MIMTRFGSTIKDVLSYDEDTGAVRFIRESDGETRSCHISELKADNGIAEILEAIPAAAKRNSLNR